MLNFVPNVSDAKLKLTEIWLEFLICTLTFFKEGKSHDVQTQFKSCQTFKGYSDAEQQQHSVLLRRFLQKVNVKIKF